MGADSLLYRGGTVQLGQILEHALYYHYRTVASPKHPQMFWSRNNRTTALMGARRTTFFFRALNS